MGGGGVGGGMGGVGWGVVERGGVGRGWGGGEDVEKTAETTVAIQAGNTAWRKDRSFRAGSR